MASLELSDNIFAEKDSAKRSLYYDLYRYRGVLKVNCIEYFRNIVTHAAFLNKLERLIFKSGYYYNKKNNGDITIREVIIEESPISYDIIESIVNWRQKLSGIPKDIKIVISHAHFTVYFNDFNLIKSLNDSINNLGKTINYSFAEIIPNFKKGVIYHKQPKNKFRLYLKIKRLTGQERLDFIKFIKQNDFHLSRSLQQSILHKSRNTFFNRGAYPESLLVTTSHHVDYDEESLTTLFAISYPDLIGKICTIEKY